MDLFEFLSHGFVQRALITGSIIAVLCGTLGVFLVLRRLSLIGDGLAHVTFGAVAIGLLLKVYPVYVAAPLVMAASLGIMKLIEKARLYGDAAIAIVSSFGIAGGILIASVAGGFNVDLFSYLFGNILAISSTEVVTSLILSAVLVFVVMLFYQDLLSVTLDEESARVTGVKTRLINRVLVLLTALTVVLAMRVVGVMLVSALLVIPPVTALQMKKGFKGTIYIACSIGVVSVVLGIFVSFAANLPTGATIVMLNLFIFLMTLMYKKIHSLR
ncbi:MAG: ABC transporter [Syntrophus sp. (in: bacteria)]|nr:ABC transporter [Syntrophus sp. (in: bacteria)]